MTLSAFIRSSVRFCSECSGQVSWVPAAQLRSVVLPAIGVETPLGVIHRNALRLKLQVAGAGAHGWYCEQGHWGIVSAAGRFL